MQQPPDALPPNAGGETDATTHQEAGCIVTQPGYPAQRIGNEPATAAAIRQQIATERARLVQAAGEERIAVRREIYRLSAEWWREVRR